MKRLLIALSLCFFALLIPRSSGAQIATYSNITAPTDSTYLLVQKANVYRKLSWRHLVQAIGASGNLGIGTTGPDRKLDILDASNPQLRLTHTDGSVYTDLLTDSGGDLTITPSGGTTDFTGNITAGNDITATGYVRAGSGGSAGFKMGGATVLNFNGGDLLFAESASYDTITLHTDGNEVGHFDISGQFGIGTTGPAALLDVGGGIATTIDGTDDLLIADDAEIDGNLYVEGDADFETSGGTITLNSTTVSGLPAAASSTGQMWLVTDGNASGDCTTGSGSTYVLCVSNGSAWINP